MADSFDAQKTHLLVIDDDKKLCRLIKDYLEPLGYDVAAASTGKESLDKALAGKFDAVILDIMMPEMDGLEVLRRLRASLSVPVLMLTGLGGRIRSYRRTGNGSRRLSAQNLLDARTPRAAPRSHPPVASDRRQKRSQRRKRRRACRRRQSASYRDRSHATGSSSSRIRPNIDPPES